MHSKYFKMKSNEIKIVEDTGSLLFLHTLPDGYNGYKTFQDYQLNRKSRRTRFL